MQGQSPTSKLWLHIRNYVGNSTADVFFTLIADSKEMETYKRVVENMNKVKSELNLCCEKGSTKRQEVGMFRLVEAADNEENDQNAPESRKSYGMTTSLGSSLILKTGKKIKK
ncbi:hypothetical protein NC653_041640 [Populus alba x Populus x berolinensis]|uniref:Uncharacterized protein n=1 Tax=Populus alba x Populus x berolinensis TaxID=444605 RepID=A0AAD6PPB9_9ROSI|nr:hypothetical protein NC653_041640 [Populus alba x Populus x berolinensis]